MLFHQHILILYAEMKTVSKLVLLASVTCAIVVLLKKTGFKAENGIGIWKMISKNIESLTAESSKETPEEANSARIKEWEVPIESSNIKVSTNIEATTEEADRYTAVIKEQAVKSKLLWPSSEGCSHIVVTLAKNNTYPLCGLLSSPCSGNTWARYLIESMTGIATGAVYNSTLLTSLGYIGEAAAVTCGCTIVQKAHSFTSRIGDLRRFKYRAIVLIRNPYKQVVSWINWQRGGGKFNVTKETFSFKEWYSISRKALVQWRIHNTEWIENMKNGIVVHYENLQNNMMGEMKRILQFLHIPFIKERYECLLNEESTEIKREKSKKQEAFLRTAFTEELRGIFDATTSEMNNLLKRKGHPSIPYDLYSFYNKTERNDAQHPHIN